MTIISEVKELNQIGTIDDGTYTIDRTRLYKVDSQHKGISRVLQVFEVVFLLLLIGFIRKRGGLPLNLAHDGTLVMMPDTQNHLEVCQALAEDIEPWSHFLLRDVSIGVEPKYFVSKGNITKP